MNITTKLAPSMALSNPFLAGSPFASSPFAPLAAPADVPADAPEGSYTYALVKSAPDVPAAEVETAAPAVEVTIKWGDSVLHVTHLAPPRPFHVGDAEGKDGGCDFSLPAERLGATRAPLVLVEGGVSYAVILPGATGSITVGGERLSVEQAIASGRAVPCAEIAGAHKIALPTGARSRVALGDLAFEVAAVHAGKAVTGKVQVDKRSLPFTALSLAVHVGLLGATAVFMPPMAMAEDGGISDEQRYSLMQTFAAMAERETEASKEAAKESPELTGGTGGQAVGEAGKMGSQTSAAKNGHYQLKGPKDNPEVRISKTQMLRDAADFGMVGLLNTGAGGDPNAITAPWAGLDSSGRDPSNALGTMWGDALGDAGGVGGLALTGIGEGGGGKFMGVGMGAVNTIGRGQGLGDGQGFGPGGHSGSRLGPGHKVTSPTVRTGPTTVSGRIPAEVIQRIVRQNFGRFRLCYENGLRSSPSLQGRVSVAFVIGRDGAVSSVQNAGSDLPDSAVVSCVVRSFYGLAFPQPDGGIVTVTYPIMLTPGG